MLVGLADFTGESCICCLFIIHLVKAFGVLSVSKGRIEWHFGDTWTQLWLRDDTLHLLLILLFNKTGLFFRVIEIDHCLIHVEEVHGL